MMLRWSLRMLLCFCTSSLLLAAAAAALLVAAASSGTARLPADTCGKTAAAAGGCARGKFLPQILLPRQSHTSASDEKLFFLPLELVARALWTISSSDAEEPLSFLISGSFLGLPAPFRFFSSPHNHKKKTLHHRQSWALLKKH